MPFQSRSSTPLLFSLLFGILALIALQGPASAAPADPVLKSDIFGNLAALIPRDTTGVTTAWRGSNQGRRQGKHEDEPSDLPKDEPSDYKPKLEAAEFKDAPEKQKKTEVEPDGPKCEKHCYGSCCKNEEWCTPMAGRKLPSYHQCCPPNYVADWSGNCCLQQMFDKGENGFCFSGS